MDKFIKIQKVSFIQYMFTFHLISLYTGVYVFLLFVYERIVILFLFGTLSHNYVLIHCEVELEVNYFNTKN